MKPLLIAVVCVAVGAACAAWVVRSPAWYRYRAVRRVRSRRGRHEYRRTGRPWVPSSWTPPVGRRRIDAQLEPTQRHRVRPETLEQLHRFKPGAVIQPPPDRPDTLEQLERGNGGRR